MRSPFPSPTRRRFLQAASFAPALATTAAATTKPALLGGQPVRTASFPSWPIIGPPEEQGVQSVLKSGRWGRGTGKVVQQFEEEYARLMGAQHCLATANGTSALFTVVNALGIGPGDEVIVPPYTFIATINVILLNHALPVFVDTDPDTFQIDARKIESAITGRTAALLPVHLGGATFDVETVQAVAQKHKLTIIEDSCQSHLAEWRGKRTGAFGAAGCFSFQASKNLNSGEGGAVLTNDPELAERCYTFHNNSRGRRQAGADFSYTGKGMNLRLTEFQGALLLAQMTRLEQQSRTREQNAQYLTSLLKEIPGITPARTYSDCTRNAYHLYMFRYQPDSFSGLSRAKFLKALAAEGIPASGGYAPLNREPFLRNTFATRGYQRIYGSEYLTRWQERNECPQNDRLCREAVWLTQTMLLGSRSDMDQIAAAVRKVQQHAGDLAKTA